VYSQYLGQFGWSAEGSEKVMELSNRMMVRDWVKDQDLDMRVSMDVEMR